MKAAILTGPGGLSQLSVSDVPDPAPPGPQEVRVAIRAAALNHLDLFVARGLPGSTLAFPHIVGADGAGEVEAVGTGVSRVRVGDRVMINPGISDYRCEFCLKGEHSYCVNYRLLGEHRPGTMAEFVNVPEQNLANLPNLPNGLSWPEAAAFTLVTLTAWRMIVTRAQVQAGETVLVWGIGGGVALAALRIAKLRGARVVVTSSSDDKLAAARRHGADVTLNHATQKVAAEVRALTGKRGVDVVVDDVGEATWEESLRCLAKGGRLVTCGATTGPKVVSDIRRVFWNHYTIMGSTMGNAAEYQEIVRVLGTGQLRPVVDRVYPLPDVRSAYERLERAEQLGKVVVQIAE